MQAITILLLILTQLFDYHSTVAFLKSGNGREGNTFLRRLFNKYGAGKVMAVKGLLHCLLIPPILLMPTIGLIGFIPLYGYYLKIIINNYKIAGNGEKGN